MKSENLYNVKRILAGFYNKHSFSRSRAIKFPTAVENHIIMNFFSQSNYMLNEEYGINYLND